MTKLDLFKTHCENEFQDFRRSIECGWSDIIQARNCGLQRCLGVADYLQWAEDISFDDIDKIYTEYRTKFYELAEREVNKKYENCTY